MRLFSTDMCIHRLSIQSPLPVHQYKTHSVVCGGTNSWPLSSRRALPARRGEVHTDHFHRRQAVDRTFGLDFGAWLHTYFWISVLAYFFLCTSLAYFCGVLVKKWHQWKQTNHPFSPPIGVCSSAPFSVMFPRCCCCLRRDEGSMLSALQSALASTDLYQCFSKCHPRNRDG